LTAVFLEEGLDMIEARTLYRWRFAHRITPREPA
jgi:hypothetical protein